MKMKIIEQTTSQKNIIRIAPYGLTLDKNIFSYVSCELRKKMGSLICFEGSSAKGEVDGRRMVKSEKEVNRL